MKRKIILLTILAVGLIFAQQANAVILDFEDQINGATYDVGESITSSGVQIDIEQFEPMGGDPINGTLRINDTQEAGGGGLELQLRGVNLVFNLNASGCTGCGLALVFADIPDNGINLGIDGNLYQADDFADLIATIQGAESLEMFVVGPPEQGALLMINNANFDTFTIGGGLLYIDSMMACAPTPEPTTLILLGLGSLSLIRTRRKRS